MKRLVAAFARRGESGVMIIEFAMLAPLAVIFVIMIYDIAVLAFLMLSLDSATLNAARYGATGFTAPGSTRDEQILGIVKDQTLGLLTDNDLEIETRVYASYADLASAEWLIDVDDDGVYSTGDWFDDADHDGVWDGDSGVPGSGTANSIVSYRVSAEYVLATPVFGDLIGPIRLFAAAGMQNEPF